MEGTCGDRTAVPNRCEGAVLPRDFGRWEPEPGLANFMNTQGWVFMTGALETG